MRSILWGAPYGGINTFPKSLVDLNYANFNAISHCEIHRGHQENQRYSFGSQNLQSSAGKIPGKISQVKSLGRGMQEPMDGRISPNGPSIWSKFIQGKHASTDS